MSSSSNLPAAEGLVAGAPNLPAGFTDMFASRYVDTGDLRRHAVIGGEAPPLLLIRGRPPTPRLRALPRVPHHDRPERQRKTGRVTLSVLAIGGTERSGEAAANTIKLAAMYVQRVVIPPCGHWLAEQAPEALGGAGPFLAAYRDVGPGACRRSGGLPPAPPRINQARG